MNERFCEVGRYGRSVTQHAGDLRELANRVNDGAGCEWANRDGGGTAFQKSPNRVFEHLVAQTKSELIKEQ